MNIEYFYLFPGKLIKRMPPHFFCMIKLCQVYPHNFSFISGYPNQQNAGKIRINMACLKTHTNLYNFSVHFFSPCSRLLTLLFSPHPHSLSFMRAQAFTPNQTNLNRKLRLIHCHVAPSLPPPRKHRAHTEEKKYLHRDCIVYVSKRHGCIRILQLEIKTETGQQWQKKNRP